MKTVTLLKSTAHMIQKLNQEVDLKAENQMGQFISWKPLPLYLLHLIYSVHSFLMKQKKLKVKTS